MATPSPWVPRRPILWKQSEDPCKSTVPPPQGGARCRTHMRSARCRTHMCLARCRTHQRLVKVLHTASSVATCRIIWHMCRNVRHVPNPARNKRIYRKLTAFYQVEAIPSGKVTPPMEGKRHAPVWMYLPRGLYSSEGGAVLLAFRV